MSQKLPVYNFERMKDTSQFNEGVIKTFNKERDEGFCLKLIFNILKNYINYIMIYHFCQKE